MRTLKVAIAQFQSSPNPAENLENVMDFAIAAASQGAKLLVCPEATMSCFGTKLSDVAQPLDGKFAAGLRIIARETGLFLIAGMFTPAEDGRVYNTLLATDGTGDAHYHKIHLFDAFNLKESDHVAPGNELIIVEAHGVKVGLATCYDVRFAKQFTALGKAGAEVICLPASWAAGPHKIDQWKLLVRARAHDSQAWIVAADQAWSEPRGKAALGVGHSMIVAPTGITKATLGKEPALLVREIDLDLVTATRQQVPIL